MDQQTQALQQQNYIKAPTYMDASQYSYQNPGSFQSVNGKMYFFPAIVQTPPEFNKSQGSPYPIDWKFESEAKKENFFPPQNKPLMGGAQMYHAQGFQNTAPSGKPDFVNSINSSSFTDLSVHFTDPRLNQETTIQYEHTTTKDGEDTPNYPIDFKGFIPGQQAQGYQTMNQHQYAQVPSYGMPHPTQTFNMPTTQNYHMPPPNNYSMPPQSAYTMPPQSAYTMPPQSAYTMPPQQYNLASNNQYAMTPMQKYPSMQTPQFASQNFPSFPNVVQHEKEVVHYVPKIETKIVEREVYVPGDQKIFVPQPFNADTYIIVPKFEDTEVKFVVSEAVVPEIRESEEVIEVEVSKYEPDIQYIDIYVPRPIAIPIKATGEYEQYETPSKKVSREEFQYSMEMNPHLLEIDSYNKANDKIFNKYVEHSREIAAAHHFEPPEPIYYHITPSIENEPSQKQIEFYPPEEDEPAAENEEGYNTEYVEPEQAYNNAEAPEDGEYKEEKEHSSDDEHNHADSDHEEAYAPQEQQAEYDSSDESDQEDQGQKQASENNTYANAQKADD